MSDAGKVMADVVIVAPNSDILNQSPEPSYEAAVEGALERYTLMGPGWKIAWSSAKPTVAPAVTDAVLVDAPESRPPALQRISLEVTSVMGEFALVFWRTY